jgi:hypothetical protein
VIGAFIVTTDRKTFLLAPYMRLHRAGLGDKTVRISFAAAPEMKYSLGIQTDPTARKNIGPYGLLKEDGEGAQRDSAQCSDFRQDKQRQEPSPPECRTASQKLSHTLASVQSMPPKVSPVL